MKLILLLLTLSFTANANYLDDNVKTLNWNGVEVVWLEDNSFPTYYMTVYFDEGAASERKDKAGTTNLMFDQITSGTDRFSKEEIVESLEFYGASYSGSVTHEFSQFSVSGLSRYIEPVMKMVCHAFKGANFPNKELVKKKKILKSKMKNIVTNHGALASRIHREISLSKTPYFTPVSGRYKNIDKISNIDLIKRLNLFNNDIHKKIYIKGPKKILSLESIIMNDCKWSGGIKKKDDKTIIDNSLVNLAENTVYLVPIKQANQAQIRIGRVLTTKEVQSKNDSIHRFVSGYLGGGFTSRLVQELRVKRGLTYSAGAYVSEQKKYGRVGINTFTKNETLVKTLDQIKGIINLESSVMQDVYVERSKRYLKGNYLFSLESTSAFVDRLLYMDHREIEYNEIYSFPKELNKIKREDAQKMVDNIFGMKKQTIVVVGDVSLKKQLQDGGYKVKIIDYKKFL